MSSFEASFAPCTSCNGTPALPHEVPDDCCQRCMGRGKMPESQLPACAGCNKPVDTDGEFDFSVITHSECEPPDIAAMRAELERLQSRIKCQRSTNSEQQRLMGEDEQERRIKRERGYRRVAEREAQKLRSEFERVTRERDEATRVERERVERVVEATRDWYRIHGEGVSARPYVMAVCGDILEAIRKMSA